MQIIGYWHIPVTNHRLRQQIAIGSMQLRPPAKYRTAFTPSLKKGIETPASCKWTEKYFVRVFSEAGQNENEDSEEQSEDEEEAPKTKQKKTGKVSSEATG